MSCSGQTSDAEFGSPAKSTTSADGGGAVCITKVVHIYSSFCLVLKCCTFPQIELQMHSRSFSRDQTLHPGASYQCGRGRADGSGNFHGSGTAVDLAMVVATAMVMEVAAAMIVEAAVVMVGTVALAMVVEVALAMVVSLAVFIVVVAAVVVAATVAMMVASVMVLAVAMVVAVVAAMVVAEETAVAMVVAAALHGNHCDRDTWYTASADPV